MLNQASRRQQRRQIKYEKGQGLVEYGLILLLVGIASIIAVGLFEDALRDTFRDFIAQGEYAPPDLQPIGGQFATRPPSPTPQAAILSFQPIPGSPIQVPNGGLATVNFNLDTVGSFTQFRLDIDNDGTDEYTWPAGQPMPDHDYPIGSYVTRLTGTTAGGSQIAASVNMQVYDDPAQLPDVPPAVSITADKYSGIAPVQVFFTSQVSFDHDSTAASYRWAIGSYVDSTSGAATAYTFSQPGTYQVVLQVTDDEGYVGTSDTITIDVISPTPLPTNTPLATDTPAPTATDDPNATPTERPTATPTETPAPTNTASPTPTATPGCIYGPYNLPGRLQAENFDCGGQGVAYSDRDSGNSGNSSYRSGEGVDLSAGGGATYVTAAGGGEWTRYEVNVSQTTLFDLTIRAATSGGNRRVQIYLDGSDVTGSVNLGNTGGGFQNIVVSDIPLLAGSRTLEIRYTNNDLDLDYIDFNVASAPTSTPTHTPTFTPTPLPPTATPTVPPTNTPVPTNTPAAATLFSDGFNRGNSTTVGNSWVEEERNNKAYIDIVSNRLCVTDSSDESRRPMAYRSFGGQTSGTLTWTFDFDWTRSGNDNGYSVYMQLGNSGSLDSSRNGSDETGVAVNLAWSDENGHQSLNYMRNGSGTKIATMSGNQTVRVVVDLDNNTYDVSVSGSPVLVGGLFENNVTIDTVRFYADDLDERDFSGGCFDDVLVAHES